jgi:hypothetical protein
MKKSKYNALKELVNAPYRISGFSKTSKVHDFLVELLENRRVHTGYYRGRGWRTTAVDYTREVCNQLDKLGIAYNTGNDAPRGGVYGNYVEITMPAFIKEVKKVMEVRKTEEEAERKAIKEKQAAHQAWIEDELAKLDITRDEITAIITRKMGYKLPDSSLVSNTFSRKKRKSLIWHLKQNHKGLDNVGLHRLLRDYHIVRFED